MRIIAAGDTYREFERTKKYLSELGEGIVLFAESSFDTEKGLDWSVEDLAQYARDFPMTIVGEKDERIHTLKKGIIAPAQITLTQLCFPNPDQEAQCRRADMLNNVSYDPNKKVMALSRICASADIPYKGSGKADLLLIASGGIDWKERIEELIYAHKRTLKPNALIVQCDQHEGDKFIYSLSDGKMVGTKMTGQQGDEYIVHNLKQESNFWRIRNVS